MPRITIEAVDAVVQLSDAIQAKEQDFKNKEFYSFSSLKGAERVIRRSKKLVETGGYPNESFPEEEWLEALYLIRVSLSYEEEIIILRSEKERDIMIGQFL